MAPASSVAVAEAWADTVPYASVAAATPSFSSATVRSIALRAGAARSAELVADMKAPGGL